MRPRSQSLWFDHEERFLFLSLRAAIHLSMRRAKFEPVGGPASAAAGEGG